MEYPIRKTAFFLMCLLLGFVFNTYAQRTGIRVQGAVLDADTRKALAGATIKNINTRKALQANEEGFFRIEAAPGDTLLIEHMTYGSSKYLVPQGLQGSNYALVQLLQGENTSVMSKASRPFPTQMQFEQAVLQTDPGQLAKENVSLDVHLNEVTEDPTNMQKYLDDHETTQQLYMLPTNEDPNNFINPERWRNFIRDWREGRFDQQSVDKLEGFPAQGEQED